MVPAPRVGRGWGLAAAGVVAMFAFAACGQEQHVDLPDGFICARCQPLQDQTLFEGHWWTAGCNLAAAPLTDAIAREFEVDAHRELVQGSFSAPLHWTYDAPDPPTEPLPPKGYQVTTGINGLFLFDEPGVYYDRGALPSDLYGDCPREVDLPVTVTLTTEDGAVTNAAIRATLRLIEGVIPAWRMFGSRDLAGVRGNLDLGLNPRLLTRGAIYFEAVSSADGPRGGLQPVGINFLYQDQADQYDPYSDEIIGQRSDRLWATWPGEIPLPL